MAGQVHPQVTKRVPTLRLVWCHRRSMSTYNQAAATARPTPCPLAPQHLSGPEKWPVSRHLGYTAQGIHQPAIWPGSLSPHAAWSSAAGDKYRDRGPVPHHPAPPKAGRLQASGHTRGQPQQQATVSPLIRHQPPLDARQSHSEWEVAVSLVEEKTVPPPTEMGTPVCSFGCLGPRGLGSESTDTTDP